MPARTDYLAWDDYFISLALVAAQRSKDPNTQVGACIAGQDNRVLALGYNGFPQGCPDYMLPWDREGEPLKTKYLYVVHAELNAIMNTQNREWLRDATLYCTLFPCNECAKVIIQSGIRTVLYLDDRYHDTDAATAARRMFEISGVKYKKIQEITLTISKKES